MAERVTIEARRGWSRAMMIFWAIEALFGLFFAGLGAVFLASEPWWLCAALVAAGLFLFLVGVMMAGVMGRVLRIRGPVIEMDGEGFIDRRISEQKVPWPEMRWGIVRNARFGDGLYFDVNRGFAATYRVAPPIAWLSAYNRPFSYPPHPVLTVGTGKSLEELAELMAQFSPASF